MSRLDQAIDNLDLEAWLSEYDDVKEGGSDEIKLRNCPKCGNDKFKLYVNVEKKLWICYRCDWGRHLGDVCQLLAEVSGRNLHDVRLELAKTAVPAVSDENFMTNLQSAFGDLPDEDDGAELEEADLPGASLVGDSSTVANRVRQYAYRRGLGDADIERYELRYSARLRSYTGEYLVFPVFRRNFVVAWQGRTTGTHEPRYVSYDDIAHWLWPLSSTYYAYVARTKSAFLVEGVFDAVGMHSVGHHNALCTFGKKISKRQVALLLRLGVQEVTIAWDPEAARDVERAALYLRSMFPRVYIVDLALLGSTKLDPGDVIMDRTLTTALTSAVAHRIDVQSQDFYQWQLRRALS